MRVTDSRQALSRPKGQARQAHFHRHPSCYLILKAMTARLEAITTLHRESNKAINKPKLTSLIIS